METYQLSIIGGVVFLIFELLTSTFIFLSISFAFFVMALVQYFNNDFRLNRDIVLFAVMTFLSSYILRKLFKKKTDQTKLKTDDVNIY